MNDMDHKLNNDRTSSDNALIRTLRSYFIIPQRYVFGAMGFFAVLNANTMRICLNMAITQMVNNTRNGEHHNDPEACPSDEPVFLNGSSTIPSHALFDWDEKTQGQMLSSFFYGYATTQVLGGYLAEKYGGKWVLGIGLFLTAIFTLVTPVAVKGGGGYMLFLLRVLQGMGEGPMMPALMIMMARWVPPNQRSFQGALIYNGAQLGNIFGSFMSGELLASNRNWAYVFYFFGGFGLLWFGFWAFLCYSTPNTHPFISTKELKYLNLTVTTAENKSTNDKVPWKAICRSPPVWALVFGAIGHDWGYYIIFTDLPKYFIDVLKFDIKTTGTLTALPYLAMWITSLAFGLICDLCIKRGWHSIKTGRIIYTSIAAVGPAICLILASYAGCNRLAAMIYFILSMALMGGFYSGAKVSALDLAPNYAGSLTSLVNTTSTFSGIITPYLIGLLTPDSTLKQWRVAFWVCFAVRFVTITVYVIWIEGKQQWWDDVRKYGYPSNWKHEDLILIDDTKLEHFK